MDDKTRTRRLFFVEILQAWQYLDVFVVSIFISSWQLGSASEFMVNQYCESLNTTFATLEFYGFLDEDDAQCFKVQPTIEIGWYLLLLGAFALSLLTKFVQDAVVQYRRDKTSLSSDSNDGHDVHSVTNEDVVTMIDDIEPVPVLFTDSFRWILIREDATEYHAQNIGTKNQDMKRFPSYDSPSYDGGDPDIAIAGVAVPVPPTVENERAPNAAVVKHYERAESLGLIEVTIPSHGQASPIMKASPREHQQEEPHTAKSSSSHHHHPPNHSHDTPEAARNTNRQITMASKKRGSFGLSPMPPMRNSEKQVVRTSENRKGIHRTDAKPLSK